MQKIFLIAFLLFAKNSYSQDFTEIYRNGILGVMNLEQQHNDTAEKYLIRALELYHDKTQYGAYFNLVKIAFSKNDTTKLKSYFSDLSCIYPKETVYKYLADYSEISMPAATFNHLYHPRCVLKKEKDFATKYSKIVDSITAYIRDRDQGIRTKANAKDKTEEQIVALEKEMHFIDSANFIILAGCIKKYGMPRLSGNLNGSRMTQIIHIDNYTNFKKIDPYLLKAIKRGEYCPVNYAYALDRSRTVSGLKPKYYWFLPGSEESTKYVPDQSQVAEINRNRKLIGLPPYPASTGWSF